jgi:hypothetical protein
MKHKTRENHCCVDIEFAGWGRFEELLETAFQTILEPSMRLRKANKSLAVSMPVPFINPHAAFLPQTADVQTCLHTALALAKWYHRNLEALHAVAQGISRVGQRLV